MAIHRTKRGKIREGAGAVKLGDEYEELYVISDLHLSPPGGAMMFDNGEVLAEFIGYVRGLPNQGLIGLVLNGDVFDFITEVGASGFDPKRAIQKLEELAKTKGTKEVFEQLREFVQAENRRLIVVLGNHDIELAIPWVQTAFARLLGADGQAGAAVRGRIFFATDGTGYRAQVGGAQVLCVHGNELDEWNYVSQERLREAQAAILSEQDDWRFEANAGTMLVTTVLNELAKKHPFVPLLKPEIKTVPPLVLALSPETKGKVLEVLKVAARWLSRLVRRKGGWLGQADDEEDYDPHGRLAPPLPSATELMMMAEANVFAGVDPLSLVDQNAMLGPTGAIMTALSMFTGRSPRAALKEWLKDDNTFEPDVLSKLDKAIDDSVGPGIDVLVAGHTHLARAAKRSKGDGVYFNTGTWARLMEIEAADLDNHEAFEAFFKKLDGAGDFDALVQTGATRNAPTLVRVSKSADGAEAILAQFDAGKLVAPKTGKKAATPAAKPSVFKIEKR